MRRRCWRWGNAVRVLAKLNSYLIFITYLVSFVSIPVLLPFC